VRAWWGLCLGVAVVSTSGPLFLAVGSASRAGLLCLHLVCAAVTVVLLAPAAAPHDAAPSTGQVARADNSARPVRHPARRV
jgi:hypothetical protein